LIVLLRFILPAAAPQAQIFGQDVPMIAVIGAVAGGDAWRRTDAAVSLTGVDGFGGTGVKEVSYTLSGAQSGGGTVQDDSTSFTVGSEGVTTVAYGGVDFAGNSAPQRTLSVRIDRTAPAITVGAPAEGARVTRGSSLTASYSCADPLSGVSSCAGTVASGGALPTGTLGPASFTVTGRDLAGNVTTLTRSYTVVRAGPRFGPKLRFAVSLGIMRTPKFAPVKLRNGYTFPVKGRLRLLGPRVKGKRRPVTAFRSFSLKGRAKRQIAMKLKPGTRRALAAGKRVRVRAQVKITNSSGERRTLNKNLVLRVKRRRS